jgi:tRNA dimethylallyltransferase
MPAKQLSIYLMGPTAAGKSALAVELAESLPVEIVSVDSAQVYRGLDIGTAKPDRALRERVLHHLIDLRDPAVTYSVAEFVADAEAVMASIRARGRVPLLTGGTMLYFRALQAGLATLPARDPVLRARLDARAAAEGWPALHAELARVDPAAAARIGVNDRQRIQRALEVYELSGTPLSVLHGQNLRGATTGDLKIVVSPQDRAELGRRIEARLSAMLAAGFVAEVAALRSRGDLDADTPALRAVGYRQLWPHVAGEVSLAEATSAALVATRQLAKRQLTWLRAEPDARWLDPDSPSSRAAAASLVRAALAGAGGP